MSRFLSFVLLAGIALAGCNPALNWREVRVGPAGAKALLPCKPDQGSRQVTLAGQDVELQMLGCEAGKALFAISLVELADSSQAAEIQAGWQTAMLAAMRANQQDGVVQTAPFDLKGAALQPPAVRLSARGQRADGSSVVAQGVWFSQGARLYHAAVYADQLGDEITEPFFSGLELQ